MRSRAQATNSSVVIDTRRLPELPVAFFFGVTGIDMREICHTGAKRTIINKVDGKAQKQGAGMISPVSHRRRPGDVTKAICDQAASIQPAGACIVQASELLLPTILLTIL
jgi:hypothetical protein